jgi:hypothetical protein
MEPTFTETASETVTVERAAQITAAITALPAAHCRNPEERESTESRDAAFLRLQDWAFTKGFALVKESVKTKTARLFVNT